MSPSPSPEPGDERARVLGQVGPYVGLGLQLAGSMVFFAGLGYLADRWLGTLPWLLIVGSLLGITAIFVKIYRLSVELSRKDRRSGKPPAAPGRDA